MSEQVSFEVKIDGEPSQWYNHLIVSKLRQGNDPLKVQKYLIVTFEIPPPTADTAFWTQGTVTAYFFTQDLDPSTHLVTAILEFAEPFVFGSDTTLNFGINADLTKNFQETIDSFTIDVDSNGYVDIECAPAPDPLAGFPQRLTFTRGSFVVSIIVTPGSKQSFPALPLTYEVAADELTNKDETAVATALPSSATITVKKNETTPLKVTYGAVTFYSAINVTVTVDDISRLQQEQFHVKVVGSTETHEFWSPARHITRLRRLPEAGIFDVSAETTVNNVQHSFETQTVGGSAKLYPVTFKQVVKVDHILTPHFVELPIVVTTDAAVEAKFVVRLIGCSPTYLIYKQVVEAKAGKTKFAVPVAPAKYTVQTPGFIHEFTVYATNPDLPKADPKLIVKADGSAKLGVTILCGANLKVPGFPPFLSFGGITNLPAQETDIKDFENAGASSVFKYIGNGDGHPEGYMKADGDVVAIILRAHVVAQKLGRAVLPLMVSYTCNLSGGDPIAKRLTEDNWLACSFGNLILSFKEANKTIKSLNPPNIDAVGYIINPDFIGACQQGELTPKSVAHVSTPLKAAITFWKDWLTEIKVDTQNIPKFNDNLHDYVLAVNWLIRTIAAKLPFTVTFGWQVNLWGTGSAEWIYGNDDPAVTAQKIATYVTGLGVFDTPRPDFLAVDRYERDDFTVESYGNKYCFGPHEWPRYFDLCKDLSFELKQPVMPWQIPSSRTPLATDLVDDIEEQHWGTGGSYILGDADLNSDYHNANGTILALPINIYTYYPTAKDLFAVQLFDWTDPAYSDFPLRGIFAVLLGGGSTTGIISNIGNAGPFVLSRLGAYGKNPIPLKSHPTDN